MISPDVLIYLLLSSLSPAAIASLTAISLNMLYSSSRILNLAHGSFLTIGAYLNYYLLAFLNFDLHQSLVISFIVMFILGLVFITSMAKTGVLLRKDYEIEEISIIITFALMLVLQGCISIFFGSTPKSLSFSLIEIKYVIGRITISFVDLLILFISLLLFSLIYLFLFSNKNFVSREILSYIQDKELATIVGVNINRINLIIGGISVGIAGLAGAFYSLLYPLNPYIGLYYTVIAFVVTAVSGIGNLFVSYFITIGIVVAQSLLGIFLPQGVALTIIYLLLVIVLIIRPKGLLHGLR